MGIRIHLVMGYGLVDVKHKGYDMVDPRINAKSSLLDYDNEATTEDYREFLKSDEAAKSDGFAIESSFLNPDHWMGKDKKKVDVFDCVTYRSEYGDPKVLCITPVWLYHDWHRYDDSIDYAMSTYIMGTNPENKVWMLDYGHYPYSGVYMHKRTGERVDPSIINWVRMMDGGRKGRWKPNKRLQAIWEPDGRATMDLLAQSAGFANHLDALENCRPVVPEEVRNLVTFGDLFTDPSVVNSLRPMIYQYWG